MTAIELRASCGAPRQTRRAAGHWLRPALATIREWRRRARGRSELARLDDRMLADLGISRAEAQYLSRIPFWKE